MGGPDREYRYREGEKTWADLLIADFERDQKKLYDPQDALNLSGVMILVVTEDTPIVLQLEDESLKITMSFPSWKKDKEKAILDDLVATFGKMYKE